MRSSKRRRPDPGPAAAPPRSPAPADRPRLIEESALRLTASYVRALRALRPRVAAATLPVGGGLAVYAGIGSPVTQASGLALSGPVRDADLARLEEFYLSRGVAAEVDLSSLADPTLRAVLERRGYQPGRRTLGLAATVQAASLAAASPPAPSSPDVRVGRVDAERFGQWIEIVARGFAESSDRPMNVTDTYETFRSMPEIRCYLATLGGKPAGGAALACVGGVAHLFGASTLPPFRGRGVHAALLRERLAAAAAAGCEVACLGVQPDGPAHRNALRAGFEVFATHTAMRFDPRGGAEILLHY